VGVRVAGFLAGCGYEVAGFDRADGADVLDLAAVRRAARGCAAIVHLAALAHDGAGSPEQIMAVNVLGTWHVLLAAEAAGAGRVVCFSSAQVLGIAAFVDVRDVAAAVRRALTVPLAGHHRLLLCAADIAGTAPSLELAARLAPGVPVTDPGRYHADPRAALIDCSAAAATLGWRAAYRWSQHGKNGHLEP